MGPGFEPLRGHHEEAVLMTAFFIAGGYTFFCTFAANLNLEDG